MLTPSMKTYGIFHRFDNSLRKPCIRSVRKYTAIRVRPVWRSEPRLAVVEEEMDFSILAVNVTVFVCVCVCLCVFRGKLVL